MLRQPAGLLALILAVARAFSGEIPTPAPGAEKEKPVIKDSAPLKHTNALAKETSPYLLQHAHNPVNWYPWGPEAFEKARKEDKPLFLSVGYSSCHWCHVMERESFENEGVARVLNEHFVSIKVDREERPDIDEIYMSAVQIVTQRGGWPMSVFMTAEGKPFYGGSYFPAPTFTSLLENIGKLWKEKRKEIDGDADRLSGAIQEQLASRRIEARANLDRALIEHSVDALAESFDAQFGGFGRRPKFPPNNSVPLLLNMQTSLRRLDQPDPRVKRMTVITLDNMARGGIHDQVGGGFHRYSTDQRWLVPHFEKMLYDNALLASAYAEASGVHQNGEYERVARDVYDWVLREMTAPEGAFYSSLDADSEGVEGKFYVWEKSEVKTVLGADAETFCEIFNIQADGNFHEEATGQPTGRNIPHLTQPLAAHAERLKIGEAELRTKVDAWKASLLAVRVKRVWPGLDDKILTAWNGLMISSLARGSILLKEPRYKDAAVKAAEFLLKNLRTPAGRWLATHRKGQSKLPAYLDDHAFLAVAFLDLFEATKDERWKKEAIAIVGQMDAHFADAGNGGYFFTADDHEKLLARTKDPIDKAIPSGNGRAGQALVRLALLTGDASYRDKAARLFGEFQGLMESVPHATESLLLGVMYYLNSAPEDAAAGPAVAARGPRGDAKATRGPVIAELLLGASALRRGARVPVAVRFELDTGFHLQAHTADEKDAAATRVALHSKDLGVFADPKYPEPQVLKAPKLGLGESIQVYSGLVVAGATLVVPGDAKLGAQVLSVKVHFQACNDKACQAPQDVVLSLPVEVVAADAPVKLSQDPVFDKVK